MNNVVVYVALSRSMHFTEVILKCCWEQQGLKWVRYRRKDVVQYDYSLLAGFGGFGNDMPLETNLWSSLWKNQRSLVVFSSFRNPRFTFGFVLSPNEIFNVLSGLILIWREHNNEVYDIRQIKCNYIYKAGAEHII